MRANGEALPKSASRQMGKTKEKVMLLLGKNYQHIAHTYGYFASSVKESGWMSCPLCSVGAGVCDIRIKTSKSTC